MLCYVEKLFTICTLLDVHPYVDLHHLYSTICQLYFALALG